MTNEKHFPKTISQWELDYDLFTNLLSLATFLRVHSNSEEVSYLSWQNTYPNLKTTCHIKLKFFLWTKLLENLLLTKYLISVGASISRVAIISGHVFMLNSAFQFIVRFIFQGGGGGGRRRHVHMKAEVGWGQLHAVWRVSSQCYAILNLLCNNRTHYESIFT